MDTGQREEPLPHLQKVLSAAPGARAECTGVTWCREGGRGRHTELTHPPRLGHLETPVLEWLAQRPGVSGSWESCLSPQDPRGQCCPFGLLQASME